MITLRPLLSSDAEAFMAWAGDPQITKSLFWDHYTDLKDARKFLKEVAEKHPWFMAVCLDGVPVGSITLDKGNNRASNRAEIGYVISKEHWGKGLASKAVELAIQRGFRDLNINRIESLVDPENIGSIRVLEKNGFQKEGLLKKYVVHRGKIRDRLIYAITI